MIGIILEANKILDNDVDFDHQLDLVLSSLLFLHTLFDCCKYSLSVFFTYLSTYLYIYTVWCTTSIKIYSKKSRSNLKLSLWHFYSFQSVMSYEILCDLILNRKRNKVVTYSYFEYVWRRSLTWLTFLLSKRNIINVKKKLSSSSKATSFGSWFIQLLYLFMIVISIFFSCENFLMPCWADNFSIILQAL